MLYLLLRLTVSLPPVHVSHFLAILRKECEVDEVRYGDYNQVGFYLYRNLLSSISKNFDDDILGKGLSTLFDHEKSMIYQRLCFEELMGIPKKNRLSMCNNSFLIQDATRVLRKTLQMLIESIDPTSLDVVLLMTPNPDITYSLELAFLIKEKNSSLPIVMLDYYNFDPSAQYFVSFLTGENWQGNNIEEYLFLDPATPYIKDKLFELVDYIVYGEGYDFIRKIFKSSKASIEGIHCKTFSRDGGAINTTCASIESEKDKIKVVYSTPVDLDTLPFPDYSEMQRIYETAQLEMSRGCTYRCIFCERSPYVPNLRFHSPEYIRDLIQEMRKYSFKDFSFFDPAFNTFTPKISNILNFLKSEGVYLKYSAQLRPKKTSDEFIQLMKDTGCYEIGTGFESGDERILNDMQKDASPSIHLDLAKQIFDHGMHLAPYIVFGFPTDTMESAIRTQDFVKKLHSISKDFDIGLGWYWWGYIQRLTPELFPKYGIKVYNLSKLYEDIDNTSYSVIIPGLAMSFTYTKGMTRKQLTRVLEKWYQLKDELGFPLYAAEPRPRGMQ